MLYLCLYLSCTEEWALYRDCLKLIMPILSLLMKFCTVPIQNLAPEQYSMIILKGKKFSAYMQLFLHPLNITQRYICKSNIALLTFLSVIAVQPVTSYNFSFLHLSVISVSPELVASLRDDRFKYSSSVRLWTSERIPASVILQLDNRLSLFRPMRCRPIWCNPKSVIFRQFERSGTFRLLRFRAICSMPSSPTQ